MFLKKAWRFLKNKIRIKAYSKYNNSIILMFHSILNSDEKRRSYYLDCKDFVSFISKYEQRIADIDSVINNPNIQSIAITFDDVRDDVFENALPILIKRRIPFTVFINISLLGKDGYITKEQLLKISSFDFATIGSHCVTHKPLKHVHSSVQKEELEQSKNCLENMTNKTVSLLAYPYGQFDKNTIKIAKSIYDFAFVSYGGLINDKNIKQKYTIHRQGVDDSTIVETVNLIEKYVVKNQKRY